MTSRINEFFCQNLHIIKNFRQVEWNVTTFISCGFWMWAFNLTLQRMMEKIVVERVMEGDCFVEKNIFSGFWRLGWWTQMIPGHTVSRLEHKQLDRSFDQGPASMMKNCWQQLPPRCIFLLFFFFFLRWQLSFLRMLRSCEKMDKNSAFSLNYWTLQWSWMG